MDGEVLRLGGQWECRRIWYFCGWIVGRGEFLGTMQVGEMAE